MVTQKVESLKEFGSMELLNMLQGHAISAPITSDNLRIMNDLILTAGDYGIGLVIITREDGSGFVIHICE